MGPAAPSGIHEPALDAVPRDLLTQERGVRVRIEREERGAEAGRERRLGLCHAALRAGDLRGIPGQEVIHGLRRRKARDRRHDPIRIAGEEEDVRGVTAHPARHVIADVMNGIRRAGVFRDLVRVEIDRARGGIDDDVLEHGAEHLGRRIDLGLPFARQPDDLRVAAALEVEDSLVGPAVLVVPDQRPRRVGGERRLPRARETEEQRHVPGFSEVRGTVHREDAAPGEEVVEDREYRLLHLAGVARTADQGRSLPEVDHHERSRLGGVRRRVGVEFRGVEDGPGGVEAGEIGGGRTQEHVVDEQRVPGVRRHEADAEAMVRIRPGEEVAYEELLIGQVR